MKKEAKQDNYSGGLSAVFLGGWLFPIGGSPWCTIWALLGETTKGQKPTPQAPKGVGGYMYSLYTPEHMPLLHVKVSQKSILTSQGLNVKAPQGRPWQSQ